MDKSVNIVFGDSLGDALSSINMNVGIGEVFRGILTTNKVVDNIGVTDTFLDRLSIP